MPDKAPEIEPRLNWRPYRDAMTDEIAGAETIGDLFDEDVRVGHARFLDHGPPSNEEDKTRVWNWSVFPFPGLWRGHTVEKVGRERSKDEAKAAAEAAYRRICEVPSARAENLMHSRELMEMRAAGNRGIVAGNLVSVPGPAPADIDDGDGPMRVAHSTRLAAERSECRKP